MREKAFSRMEKLARRYGLWLVVIGVVAMQLGTAQAWAGTVSPASPTGPLVRLEAGNNQKIQFRTQNGKVIAGQSPETKLIPHLVLFRNGKLANREERYLRLELVGVRVQDAGLVFSIKVETQHEDPDLGRQGRIVVWEQSQCVPDAGERAAANLVLEKEFPETVIVDGEPVGTPSGYYRVELIIKDRTRQDGEPVYAYAEDYAFLMESQWVAPLDGLEEFTPGAAPDELVVYYGDMYPFQKDPHDPGTRLPRASVHDYIARMLGPALVAAVQEQTNEWNFPWHDSWVGFNEGSTGEQLEVALVYGYEWFHGKASTQANGGISINLDYENRSGYDSLLDWIVSVFHHELFHNLQRSQSLANGLDGDVAGKQEAWEFISEGTAVLAAAAGNPEVEFAGSSRARSYASRADRFLVGTQFFPSGLETRYPEIDPYSFALYWQFLYEQCSGAAGPLGEPETGMQVIRQTLNSLYASADLVDISKEELVDALPSLMDKVFGKAVWCPFHSYEDSLVAFARAIYMLRLEDGRCERVGVAGCGFYDPQQLYARPEVEQLHFQGRELDYTSGIGNSYGIAFVEVILDPPAQEGSLMLAFEAGQGGLAEFNVQVWKLAGDQEGRLVRVPPQAYAPDVLAVTLDSRGATYPVGRIDTAPFYQLGLVITRLDSREGQDPVGAFTISLQPVSSRVQGEGD